MPDIDTGVVAVKNGYVMGSRDEFKVFINSKRLYKFKIFKNELAAEWKNDLNLLAS